MLGFLPTHLEASRCISVKIRLSLCRPLAICREIADAHKHSRVDREPDPKVSTAFILGPGEVRAAETSWFIVDGDDWLDPRAVIEGAIMYWIRFLGDRDMLRETPIEEIYRKERSLRGQPEGGV